LDNVGKLKMHFISSMVHDNGVNTDGVYTICTINEDSNVDAKDIILI
jgi:hypothetical protein